MKYSVLIILVLCLSLVSSNSYTVEFSQVGGSVVIKEAINGVSKTSYVDTNSMEKSSSGYIFLKKIDFKENFSNWSVIFNLDEGFVLSDDGAYPIDYVTGTDGRLISLIWAGSNVSEGESLAFLVNIKGTNGSNVVYYILEGILAIFAIYLVTKLFKKRKGREIDKYLLDIERSILVELSKSDRHEMWQKEIQRALNLSKAKTSRVIRNLETRGLIEKIPFGNTNKIRLK